ncbi:MAG: prephenate dehydratase [Candidatus Ratteibacteria bacterium]|nr:prephenate dehydratase [Candidatus Ratteibacteria bacterium]
MSLEDLRQKIDKIDAGIIQLINERARMVIEIGSLKKRQGKDIYVPEREQSVYRKLIKKNKGPMSSPALKSIYKEIMANSLALEKPLSISYLGPQATFTHMAAREKFGVQSKYIPARSIKDCFAEVTKGRADYAVVPIENSTEGAVNHTLDMFVDSDLVVCAEIFLDVSHYLLSNTPTGKIRKIYSNRQAIAQCRNWLEDNLPNAKLVEAASTSEGARKSRREKDAAAIASKLASLIYDLNIAAEKIEDVAGNVTRFLVIGKTLAKSTGRDRTSLMFSIKDRPGALYRMLKPFALNKINLTKIESRPSRKKAWDYIFFVDLDGHLMDVRVKKALKELERECRYLKILGSYPRN